MNKSFSTSMAMPPEQGEWLGTQARIRDVTASSLMRRLLTAARNELEGGPTVGIAGIWPPVIETPQRTRANLPRLRDRRGRYRHPDGKFVPE